MHACVWQIEGKKAYQIAEIITKPPKNKTQSVCDEFKRLYPNHKSGLIIYGDPSGKDEDTRQEQGSNDYTIIMRELSNYKPSKRVSASHPSVKMRGNFINTIFEAGFEGVEFFIDSKCVKTIEDYQFIKEAPDGTKLKEKVKDLASGITYEKWGHLSDANDYFHCEAFKNEYQRYQRGPENREYIVGRNIPKQVY
jgi:phage terminase large subunit